jgi:adenine-specific DNA-methyltransferase
MELGELGLAELFEHPKPVGLLSRCVKIAANSDDVVLDFFAGAATTAHAILELNKQDGGNRKFILVQLPEPTNREDYRTIADITKERVRRVIKKLDDEDEAAAKPPAQLSLSPGPSPAGGRGDSADRGFRVFKLAESNFMPWDATVSKDAHSLTLQLEGHVNHIRDGRTQDDLLYEILLKSGFPLAAPVATLTLAGLSVHSVANRAMLICLERKLTLELIRAMAELKPERIVCLDEGFTGNDQLKANAVQIFKTKGVTSFKTV